MGRKTTRSWFQVTCHECDGNKTIIRQFELIDHKGYSTTRYQEIKCNRCRGKGTVPRRIK